ncbi:hypothetical protein BDZ91DRAFT_385091 [Kalaharituber pfeilii]|nr:hypothetical protein BDZ91DRAFT_385091 [Kalaharituber pfeilii]
MHKAAAAAGIAIYHPHPHTSNSAHSRKVPSSPRRGRERSGAWGISASDAVGLARYRCRGARDGGCPAGPTGRALRRSRREGRSILGKHLCCRNKGAWRGGGGRPALMLAMEGGMPPSPPVASVSWNNKRKSHLGQMQIPQIIDQVCPRILSRSKKHESSRPAGF